MDVGDKSKGEFLIFDKTGNTKLDSRGGEPTAATLLVWAAEGYYLINKKGITSNGLHIRESMPTAASTLTGRSDCESILLDANEAMDQYELNGGRFFLRQHNLLLRQYNACLAANTGSSTNTNTNTTPAPGCERDAEIADETLHSFKINGWGTFDAIANAFWETSFIFHADIISEIRNSFGTQSTQQVKYVSESFSKDDIMTCNGVCQGKLKGAFKRIWTDWNREQMADPILVVWSEVDNGSSKFNFSVGLGVKFTVPVPGGTLETSRNIGFNYEKNADNVVQLGSERVFYCDRLKNEYNTGSMTFFMRHP
jgi:hypothetical protein